MLKTFVSEMFFVLFSHITSVFSFQFGTLLPKAKQDLKTTQVSKPKAFIMSKLGRSCYFHAFTSVFGFLFLISFGYNCFSPVLAFVESPLSRTCPERQRRISSAIALSQESDDGEQKSLLEFLSPISSCKVNQMSGTDLAYVGDAVFELFIRSRHVWPSKRTSDLQNTVVGIVRGM